MKLYPERLNRDFDGTDENTRILEAYHKVIDQNTWLNEDATADALKTLKAIMGSLKDDKENDVYKMASSMMKSYEKNKGFSKDQANWIYKTSKSMFK
jgi:hypothetical protein